MYAGWPLFVSGARVQSDTQAGGGVALLAAVRKGADLELTAVFTIPTLPCAMVNQLTDGLE